ncbi:hypothetical protein BN59_00623 [Legionella massiliensis]|uniref:Uncharacterized protein n=2 Tax=Legionella massiliensis TaxID=1034943 RepID=A0A078KPM2_9GAMM|nr:hypothetical protein BN59_00623 [Legionella massiliensis]CEE12093.1 hypothetical protein BN1094_00623 [Legionella massiliensis]
MDSFSDNFDQNSNNKYHTFLKNLLEDSSIKFNAQEIKAIKKGGIALIKCSAALALICSSSFSPVSPAVLGIFLLTLSQKNASTNPKILQKSKEENFSTDIHQNSQGKSQPTLQQKNEALDTTKPIADGIDKKRVNSTLNESDLIYEIYKVIKSLDDKNLTESDKVMIKGVFKSCSSLLALSLSLLTANSTPIVSIPLIHSLVDRELDNLKTQPAANLSQLDLLNLEMMSSGYF